MSEQLLLNIDPKLFTILVVDDNATNLKVLVNYLKEYGFRLIMANDGASVWKRLAVAQPDLILLDVMMPDMDGFEVSRRLKADEKTAHIPIIFMTALAGEEDKVKGFEVGAIDYVTKPLQQREVLVRVMTHLQIQAQTKKLQAQALELAKLNANKDRFFSIVAHDLKSPFLPLIGNLELITELAHTLPLEDIIKMSGSSHRAAKKIYHLLENLLQWAQIQLGGMKYRPTDFYLQPLVQQLIEVFDNVAAIKAITLIDQIPADLIVHGDTNMTNTIIRNLINNALKFTPPNGRVIITAKNHPTTAKMIEIAVSDSGVGISETDQQKLFRLDITHSTAGTDHERGTGLGLIICKEMVESHGGQIGMTSKLGQGTTVFFTLAQAEY